jgi:hypothetical protein
VVYFGGFFTKLEFSRGFLYILFTGRNSATAIARDIIFFSLAGPVGDYIGVHTVISLEFFYILFAGIISEAAIVGGTGDISSDA